MDVMSRTFSQNDYSVFGEQIVAEPTPVVQISNKYALDPATQNNLETFEATGGSADQSNNLFRCQTGTSAGGYGVIRSKNDIIYLAGEAIECRITAAFTTGIATSLQFAGMFSLTETVAFGYDGADFSVIHEYDGEAEVQTIQVTATPSGSETATVTLDGDAVSCSLTNSTVQTNAFEIVRDCEADATVNGKWRFEQIDDTVYAISKSVGDKTGTMSFASSTATATVTELNAGVAKSESNVAQASWNVNTAPFSGFDPTKLNLYKIRFGYLGVAGIEYLVYNPNTAKFVLVHRSQWANAKTTPQFGNPDMKVGWTAASLGSSGTNLTVTGASAQLSILGKEQVKNAVYAANNSVSSVGTTLTNIITLKDRLVYGTRYNLGKIKPIQVSVDNDHNKGIIVEIYKNADVAGTPNFQFEEENNSNALIDKAGTTVTNGVLIDAFVVAPQTSETVDLSKLSIELLTGEKLVVATKTVSGSSTNISAAITWIEEK